MGRYRDGTSGGSRHSRCKGPGAGVSVGALSPGGEGGWMGKGACVEDSPEPLRSSGLGGAGKEVTLYSKPRKSFEECDVTCFMVLKQLPAAAVWRMGFSGGERWQIFPASEARACWSPSLLDRKTS